jgi:predicted amidophosphoribosyltransferase
MKTNPELTRARLKSGMCVSCGTRASAPGRVWCTHCTAKLRKPVPQSKSSLTEKIIWWFIGLVVLYVLIRLLPVL